MNLASIILFTYNRPNHLQKTLDALKENIYADKSVLYVFSDAAKSEKDSSLVDDVRAIIKNICGFKEVIINLRKENLGLAESIISGVTEVIQNNKKVIVLEDDLLTSHNFLCFMNQALDKYESSKSIFSISGYTLPIKMPKLSFDVFFSFRYSSWGWATWEDRWLKTDWEVKDFHELLNNKNLQSKLNRSGEDLLPMLKAQQLNLNNSWAVRWAYTNAKNDAYCVYPVISKVMNIGTDASGTNFTRSTTKYDVLIDEKANCTFTFSDEVQCNTQIEDAIKKIVKPSLLRKTINRFKLSI